MLLDSGITETEFEDAAGGLDAGAPAAEMLDDRFVDAFAVAGTAEDCLARAATYANAGVTELVLTFSGPGEADEIAYLGAAYRASTTRSTG